MTSRHEPKAIQRLRAHVTILSARIGSLKADRVRLVEEDEKRAAAGDRELGVPLAIDASIDRYTAMVRESRAVIKTYEDSRAKNADKRLARADEKRKRRAARRLASVQR